MNMLNLNRKVLIGALLITSPMTTAELVGTLFSSPEQRAYLNFLRQDFLARSLERGFNIAETEIPDIPEDAAVPTTPPVYTLEGISTRKSGDLVVWLNGQRYTEAELPTELTILTQGGIRLLQVTYAGNRYTVKPGQTLDLGSTEGVVETSKRQVVLAHDAAEPDANTSESTNGNSATDGPISDVTEDEPASEPDETIHSDREIAGLAESIRALPPESLTTLIETLELSSEGNESEEAENADTELE